MSFRSRTTRSSSSDLSRRKRRELIAAAVYVAAMLFFVYAIARPAVGYGSDAANVAILVALAALHVGTGWLIARWWAVLLPLVVIPLAIPAGTPDRGEDPLPIWFGLAWFVAPIGGVLIGIAVAVRRLSLEPARR